MEDRKLYVPLIPTIDCCDLNAVLRNIFQEEYSKSEYNNIPENAEFFPFDKKLLFEVGISDK